MAGRDGQTLGAWRGEGPVKVVFGIAGALFHLLLVAAVLVLVYYVIRAEASRRT